MALLAVALLASVGCRRAESPEERVTRLRQQYDVKPTGVQPRTGVDGAPEIALDVLVLNTGKESLAELTFVVHIVDPGGNERLRRPITLAVGDLVPGVTAQVSALLPGVTLAESESVLLELEAFPDAAARARYPEYRTALAAGSG